MMADETDLRPLRLPTRAAIMQVARSARAVFRRPTLEGLIYRSSFYWTPDETRALPEGVKAEVDAGRAELALAAATSNFDKPDRLAIHRLLRMIGYNLWQSGGRDAILRPGQDPRNP